MLVLPNLSIFLIFCCFFGILTATSSGVEQIRPAPIRGRDQVRAANVTPSRTWMMAADLLAAAHHQAGLLYAAVSVSLDVPVGPFNLDEPVTVESLAAKAASAAGADVRWINDIAIIEKKSPPPDDDSRGPLSRVSVLDACGDSSVVVELTRLAGHDDPAVRLHALAALDRVEPDFMRTSWPGRVSILEVLADHVDRQALLLALEQGGPAGGRVWKLAVSALGRARERVLARHLWEHVWMHTPGTMQMGLWGLARCGDPCGGWAARARIKDTETNEAADRYLAAMAIGECGADDRLAVAKTSAGVEDRRAAAFGLGFCRSRAGAATTLLTEMLDDSDPAARFVACQSLARLGVKDGIGKLLELATKQGSAGEMKSAAMTALVAMGRPEAGTAVTANLGSDDPLARAAAAELLGDHGGVSAAAKLTSLLTDKDNSVRCAAACSLARLCTDAAVKHAAAMLEDKSSNADLRIAVLLGLGRSLSPAAAEPLAKVACEKSAPARLRHYAVIGLAQLADSAGQKTLAALADCTSDVYLPLAVRLLRLDSPRKTAEFLIPMLTHADREGACNAAGRLAELGCGAATLELLEGSDVLDNHTRMEHMWGAVRSPGREVTLALAQAASSKRSEIRKITAMALGGRLYPEAVDALINLARDEQPTVRLIAARSLGVTPDRRGVDVLCRMADSDPDLPAALEAVRALRRRDFRDLPEVRNLFKKLAGTQRDAGGLDAKQPPLADQPGNTFVLRAWDEHAEEDYVCNLTYEASLCYDAHNERVVNWGAHGRRYDTPQTGLTWFFDPAGGRWARLVDSRHWPNGICGVRGTMYDEANKVVLSPRSGGNNSHGWHGALRANLMHSSPWVLDVTTDQWYAARAESVWAGGYMPGSHDPRHGITLWWRNELMAFDAYANRWFEFKPVGPAPQWSQDTGGVFDPQTGRFIAIGTDSTWAFDPTTSAWTDLKPSGELAPPCPMVYDPGNDVMLAFKVVDDRVGVWVYHIRKNCWESLPAVHPCPARGKIWDVTFDSRNGVAVFAGTNGRGPTASLNIRETWTYRYKPVAGLAVARSPQARCATKTDGRVTVNWSPLSGEQPAGYIVERGLGEQPWLAKWQQLAKLDGKATEFAHSPADKELAFYRVTAIDKAGKPAAPGLPARTSPPIVRHVTAVVRTGGLVCLRWTPPAAQDIVGYNVYRVTVELSPWTTRFLPESLTGKFTRITDRPVPKPEFVDKTATVAGPADELNWPGTFAYVVRAVNAFGLESGPSPVTLALPDPPGPVRVVPWADGRRLVLWSTCLSGGVDRYVMMRMDCWQRDYVFRMHGGPMASPACWDAQPFPTTDRRLYYASGIDGLGAIGTPTSGEWSLGLP